jgi:hypothetical protein
MKCDISMFREQAFTCPVPMVVQESFMNVLYFCRTAFTPKVRWQVIITNDEL